MIKKLLFIAIIFCYGNLVSQDVNLDKYEYIIVSDKFDFLTENDQYRTSSLTKFLLKKKGFKVFLSNEELPEDLLENRCKALTVKVRRVSSMLRIKTVIEAKDCFEKTIYTSKVGTSYVKEYKRGYPDAIRKTYELMEDFNYSYNANNSEFIEEIKEEAPKVNEEIVKPKMKVDAVSVKKDIVDKNIPNKVIPVLYAQPKDDGFQLVNIKPEVVFIVLKTSKEDFFIIKNKNGTLYKSDETWIAEYYEDGKLKKEKYQIKF